MQINYEKRPTQEQLDNYRNKLEKFLRAHSAKIEIKLWDRPLRFECYINSEHTSTDYQWIEEIKVSAYGVKDLPVTVMSEGMDENTTDAVIWVDAFSIQEQLYKRLGRSPAMPPQTSGDPYWKLWRDGRRGGGNASTK